MFNLSSASPRTKNLERGELAWALRGFLLTLSGPGGNIARKFAGAPMQDLYAEFKAVVQAFNASGIPYAVCGGLAYSIHVEVRATIDMDFLIQASDLPRCQQLLVQMGYTPHPRRMVFRGGTVTIQRLWKPQEQGGDVLGIDLLVSDEGLMPGVWGGREEHLWEDLSVWVVSRDGLVGLKRLRGSEVDLADIRRLTEERESE